MDRIVFSSNNASDRSVIPRAVVNAVLLKDKLNVSHINVQSLCARKCSKFEELKRIVSDSKIDIACFTETWMDSSISDSMINIPGFNVIRNDRNRHGGGICIYVKKGLAYRMVKKSIVCVDDYSTKTEYLIIEILIGNDRLLLAVYYNPPEVDCSDLLCSHFEEYSVRFSSTYFIGDFNTDPFKHTRRSSRFNDVVDNMSFERINSEPTFFYNTGSSLLDLFLTDTPDSVLKFSQISLPGISKHDLLFASLNFSNKDGETGYWYRDYLNYDHASLHDAFLAIDWNRFFCVDDPDILINMINNHFTVLHDNFFPLQFRKFRKNPWFNADIERAMINRDLAYRNWKHCRSAENKAEYKRLRNVVSSKISNAKRSHDREKLNLNLPCKQLWNNVRNLGVSTKQPAPVINQYPANDINEYFSSNFSEGNNETILFSSNNNGFTFRPIVDFEIINAIFSIKSNAVGFDGLPIKFLKIITPFALPVFEHLFNSIIVSSKFPTEWKRAKIIPINKKPNVHSITNLRPISLLPTISKVFEKLLKIQISEYIHRMNYIHCFQSGFRSHHSTETALLKVHDDIAKSIDKKGITILLLIDFSKAFDRVVHSKLINKLISLYNFSNNAAKLISSYLGQRSQAVFCNGSLSEFRPTISGVPQGSVLGPLLFSLFINDLPAVLDFCSIHLFADDVQIYICTDENIDLSSARDCMNHDLHKLLKWSKDNLLPINPEKTKAMLISRQKMPPQPPRILLDGVAVQFVDRANNLGIIFQNNLEWDAHVNRQCSKIYGSLKRLNLTTRHCDSATKLKLFKSLILPHFIYGDFIYTNALVGSIDKLRVALNACIRYVYNLSRFSHVSHLQKNLVGCSFVNFYRYRSCMNLFRIIQTSSPAYLFEKLVPLRGTRTKSYRVPQHSSSYYSQSFFVRGIVSWNSLPTSIKVDNTISSFKRDLLHNLQ
uniref:Putative reverse transcriptase n=1 Tax=Aedes albopictus TaxID=7160 RepID=A0A1W7R6J3_AEDAL